jgi:hypothetical protein
VCFLIFSFGKGKVCGKEGGGKKQEEKKEKKEKKDCKEKGDV